MNERVRTIRLYGQLGARFGRVHKYVCSDTAGAVRALCSMVPGFQAFMASSKDRGLGYACFIGKQNLDEEGLKYPPGNEDIRIAPIVIGSGRGGLFSIIVGAVLIGAAFITGGTSIAAWSTLQMAAGAMGAAMVFTGISQYLVKTSTGMPGVESADNGASYGFNGPINVTAQGNPVPDFYGEMIVGSVTVSGDMYSEDQQ